MQVSDFELVTRAIQGDESAFLEIVDRHAQDLYRLVLASTGNASDAEDILQETFAGAFKSLPTFEGRASLKTWLIRILFKQEARHRRYSKLRQTEPLDAIKEKSTHDSSNKTEAEIDIQTMLDALSPDLRQTLVLRELQGMSYREIAEALEIPIGTVESRLSRARLKIKERFKGYF